MNSVTNTVDILDSSGKIQNILPTMHANMLAGTNTDASLQCAGN